MDDGSIHNLYHEPGPSRFLLEHLRYLAAMECMLDQPFMKKTAPSNRRYIPLVIYCFLDTSQARWQHFFDQQQVSMHLTWSALVWHCNDTNALVRTGHWKRML